MKRRSLGAGGCHSAGHRERCWPLGQQDPVHGDPGLPGMDPPRPRAEPRTARATGLLFLAQAQGCLLGRHPPKADQAPSHHITSVPHNPGADVTPAGQTHGSERPGTHPHLESSYTPSHPSTPSACPHPLQREPGADKTLGQGGGRQGTGDAGERAQGAGQGCADSWSCQSENREPHPQPWGVPWACAERNGTC